MKTLLRLTVLILFPTCVIAQEFPEFIVTPTVATVALNSSKDFRAVNKEGRAANAVRWSISSTDGKLHSRGDLVTAIFSRPGTYTLYANGAEGSGSATIHVIDVPQLPENTVKWSLDDLPGCKNRSIVPAVPSPNSDVDVFVNEQCPFGNVVRAVSAEGFELWRTVTDRRTPVAGEPPIPEKKSFTVGSACDRIKPGMTKDEVGKLPEAKSLKDSERAQDIWTLDENESECRITFKDAKVVRKQKVIAN